PPFQLALAGTNPALCLAARECRPEYRRRFIFCDIGLRHHQLVVPTGENIQLEQVAHGSGILGAPLFPSGTNCFSLAFGGGAIRRVSRHSLGCCRNTVGRASTVSSRLIPGDQSL